MGEPKLHGDCSQLVAYIMGVDSSGRESISDTGTYEPIKVTELRRTIKLTVMEVTGVDKE